MYKLFKIKADAKLVVQLNTIIDKHVEKFGIVPKEGTEQQLNETPLMDLIGELCVPHKEITLDLLRKDLIHSTVKSITMTAPACINDLV